jgi:hypothetical protein
VSTSDRTVEEIVVPGDGSWKVTLKEKQTLVERRVPKGSWKATLAGQFRVPIVTTRGMRAGPSSDGTSLALVASSPGSSSETRFVVVTKSNATNITLTGQWTFDAISPDGRRLYLAQSIGGDAYIIRPVDVFTGTAGVALTIKSVAVNVVPSDEDGPRMEGLPMERLASSPDGFVLTLYDGPGFPFVHALQIRDSYTLCYDLPKSMKAIAAELTLRSTTNAAKFDVMHKGKIMATLTLPLGSASPALQLASAAPVTTRGS